MPTNHEGWTHHHRWGPCGFGYERYGFLGHLRLGILELTWVRGNLFTENAELRDAHSAYLREARRLKHDLADALEALKHTAQRDKKTGRWCSRRWLT